MIRYFSVRKCNLCFTLISILGVKILGLEILGLEIGVRMEMLILFALKLLCSYQKAEGVEPGV